MMPRWFRLAGVLAAVAGATAGPAHGAPPGPGADLYVAPDGSDRWSGTRPAPNAARTDGPLATVAAAQRAARALRRLRPGKPVTVLLRGGTCRITRPLRFTPEDSGTAAAPITYAAYPGERPVIDGGRRITGLRRQGKLWSAALPEVRAGRWSFSHLFVNGARRRRARVPNTGFLRIASYDAASSDAQGNKVPREQTAFVFRPGDIRPWKRLDDAVVVAYQSWETSLLRIKSIEAERSIVEFTGPAAWRFGYWGPNQRYHVENVREALDSPGEWYLDRGTGVLSYFPLPGEDPARAEVVAPVTEELLRLEGLPELGLYVEHVRFRGIAFRHADWSLEPGGHSDAQAAWSVPAAITATGARHCALEACEVAHVGRYGVWLRRGTRGCRVARCHLHDLGAGGVRIGEMVLPASPADAADGNVVDNNYIHDYGEVFAAGVGVLIGQSSGNRVTHNEIHDGCYTGVSVGWDWAHGPTHAHRNLIAHNHIHHVMRRLLSDGAGIYTLGTSPGTALRGNVIHDVFPYEQPAIAWGIYLDAESNGILVEGNLCYDVHSGGLMMHNGAFENTVRNNIFARSAEQLIWRAQPVGGPNTFERNVCFLTQGLLFLPDASPDLKSTWNRNLYWRAGGGELLFNGDETLAEWRERGLDGDSLVADPQFVHPARGDFRLKRTSPAITRLGFRPLEPGRCGLYGDPAWVALPRRARFAPAVLPPAPPAPGPAPVDDGFEGTAVGEPPAGAVTALGEVAGGSIGVTGERANAGERSLKVGDAPGLRNTWDPHLFYQPRFRKGTARLRLKLWIGPGAAPWMEWRDGFSPYHVGPSLRLDGQDRLVANGKVLMALPREQWVALQVACPLGKEASGAYDLAVTLPGGEPQRFAGIACDPQFRRLDWLGFVAEANAAGAFYLDDLRLQAAS